MSEKAKSKSKEKKTEKSEKGDAKTEKTKSEKSSKDVKKSSKTVKDAKSEKTSKKAKNSELDIIEKDLILENDLNDNLMQNSPKTDFRNNYSNIKMNPNQMQNQSYLNQQNQNRFERCDGCYEGIGNCFCVNCEKIFCKICEDQIHIVPINRNHERVPITDVHHLKKLCYHHNTPLKFYCESCEEPICHECQMIGPHNSKLHRISNIFESFRKKFSYINNLVNKSLLGKYDQLTNQIQAIEFIIDEIKTMKNSIEREIRTEYSAMIENLRSAEGKKLAILQYESAILSKDINKIQDIINSINDIQYSDSPDMIGFLIKYKMINENVELCISKPFKRGVEEFTLDDFPRELEEKNSKIDKYNKMKKLLKAKDDIIWNLILERKAREEKEILKLKEKTHNEISEWAKLSDKYAMELKKFHLLCHFCGCYMDENTVNSLCMNNSDGAEHGQFTVVNKVPVEMLNTKRHFFNPPKEDKKKATMSTGINTSNKILPQVTQSSQQEQPTINLKPINKEEAKSQNPFEHNILNDTKYSSYRSRPNSPGVKNLRYSDESLKGIYIN
jgi:hypothetical protein